LWGSFARKELPDYEDGMATKKTENVTENYSAKNIDVLEGLDAVRMRPGMYIGSTGIKGLHHILWEIVDNAIDEAANGHATKVTVTLHSDGSASVEDNGRGIPTDIHPKEKVSGVQLVFTKLHAGGKFGQGNYEYSGGLHGVGASVTNALSEWLTVEVYRKHVYKMSFRAHYNKRKAKWESGVPDGPLEDTGVNTRRTGTLVRFKPDANVFSEVDFDLDTVEERLNELAFLNRGIEITLIDERITMAEAKRRKGNLLSDEDEIEGEEGEGTETVETAEDSMPTFDFEGQGNLFAQVDEVALESEAYRAVYRYEGGIIDFVKSQNAAKKKLYAQPIYYSAMKNDIQVEFAIQHTGDYTESGTVKAPVAQRAGDYTFLGYFTENGTQVFDGSGTLVPGALSGLTPKATLRAQWQRPAGSVARLVYRGQLTKLGKDEPAVSEDKYEKKMHFRVYDGESAETPLWEAKDQPVTVNKDGSFVATFGDETLAELIATGSVSHVGVAIGDSGIELTPRRALRPVAAVNRALVAEAASKDVRIGNLVTENALAANNVSISQLEVYGTVTAPGAGPVEVSPIVVGEKETLTLLRGDGVKVFSNGRTDLGEVANVLRGQKLKEAPADGIALVSSSKSGSRGLRIPGVIQYCRKGDWVRAPASEPDGVKVMFFPFVGK